MVIANDAQSDKIEEEVLTAAQRAVFLARNRNAQNLLQQIAILNSLTLAGKMEEFSWHSLAEAIISIITKDSPVD